MNIAVSGLNATDNPSPGVGVIRAIKTSPEFSGTITGFLYDPMEPGAYIRGVCDNAFIMPLPSAGAKALLSRIENIHSRFPIDVIIPTLDSELPLYLEISSSLLKMGIKTFLPTKESLSLSKKSQMAKLAEMKINVPKSVALLDIASLYKIEDDFNFPVMVKGQFYEAYLAYSINEAAHYFMLISNKWGVPVIVQEFITGVEYDVIAFGDGEGNLLGSVAMRKMLLTEKGKAWGGVTVFDKDMDNFVRHTIGALKWRGACELEIIKEKDTKKFSLIEINPRFPAWCYLCVGAGKNLPWALVQMALGKSITPFTEQHAGVLFLRHSVDNIYNLSEYQSLSVHGELLKISE